MPKPGTHGNRDYSQFCSMSMEQLEEILRMDAMLSDEDEPDMDAILYIMEVLAEREKEKPTRGFTDVETALNTFNEKYRPYAGGGKSLYEDEDEDSAISDGMEEAPFTTAGHARHFRRRNVFRVAIIAAALVALLLAGTITAYAFSFDLWGTVAKWGLETFGFQVTETVDSDPVGIMGDVTKPHDVLQAALDNYGITVPVAPMWIPEGFELTEFKIDASFVWTLFDVAYTNEGRFLSVHIVQLYGEPGAVYEKDGNEVAIYERDGIEHYLMTNLGHQLAAWQCGDLECSIGGEISREELIQMIDSIYER